MSVATVIRHTVQPWPCRCHISPASPAQSLATAAASGSRHQQARGYWLRPSQADHGSDTRANHPRDEASTVARSPSADRPDVTTPSDTAAKKPTVHGTGGSQKERKKPTIAEQDEAMFRALHDRDGGGLGNEIVSGEYEKGMKKNTRANQHRVI